MRAERAVFHPGTVNKGQSRHDAAFIATDFLVEIMSLLDESGYSDIALCPETLGKLNQLGDLDEVLYMCLADRRLTPCIDFGHLHCRGLGAINGIEDYAKILDRIEEKLGKERARSIHIHFSRIEFTKGGEKMHHTLDDTQYGPEFLPLAQLLKARGYLRL